MQVDDQRRGSGDGAVQSRWKLADPQLTQSLHLRPPRTGPRPLCDPLAHRSHIEPGKRGRRLTHIRGQLLVGKRSRHAAMLPPVPEDLAPGEHCRVSPDGLVAPAHSWVSIPPIRHASSSLSVSAETSRDMRRSLGQGVGEAASGDDGAMGAMPGSPPADRPREWLALPGGRIRRVVSVPGIDGPAELLTPAAWLARLQPTCRCGRPRLGSGQTCGSAECVARLCRQGLRTILPRVWPCSSSR
jgi:hypothetical protein